MYYCYFIPNCGSVGALEWNRSVGSLSHCFVHELCDGLSSAVVKAVKISGVFCCVTGREGKWRSHIFITSEHLMN